MTFLDPRHVARALGGASSGNRVMAPGPGHSSADRSLTVLLDFSAPEGFVVHSFAGDDWQSCRDHVRERLGLPKPEYRPDSAPMFPQYQRARS